MRIHKANNKAGFTLVEIMIVVVIIGLLAAMAIQTFNVMRKASLSAVLANDFRKYADAFETHAMEFGNWPEDAQPGVVPDGMEGALSKFDQPSAVLGNWDWDYNTQGVIAGVTLINSTADVELMQKVDEKLDDGDLTSGRFQNISGRFTLILEK